ncbi:MAG: hypothetical protein JWN37_82 [Candidatus Nomurabacteria bacterium]|nr:hypothetical protein [Candidatus Nomurabacteria bacterium]
MWRREVRPGILLNMNKKVLISLLVVIIILATAYFLFKENQMNPLVLQQVSQSINAPSIQKKEGDITVSTTTPKGQKVMITFSPCDTEDTSSCFGSDAFFNNQTSHISTWDLVSTSNEIDFGVMSNSGQKWPYTVRVDFGTHIYTMEEYDYFKNILPLLFKQYINISQ